MSPVQYVSHVPGLYPLYPPLQTAYLIENKQPIYFPEQQTSEDKQVTSNAESGLESITYDF
jgi:hypothetical protein